MPLLEKELNVFEAYTRDVGRNIARIDYDTMDALNLNTGTTILLKSKKDKIAVGKALPLYPADEGKKMIRIDGIMRKNLDVIVKESIIIQKTETKHAEQITVRPLEATPPIDENYIAECLEGSPVIKHSAFYIPYFGSRITFVVEDTKPEGAVSVTPLTTKVIINAEPMPKKLLEIQKKIKDKQNSLLDNLKGEVENSQNLSDILLAFNKIQSELTQYTYLYETIKLMYYDSNLKPPTSINKTLKEAISQWQKANEEKKKEEKK